MTKDKVMSNKVTWTERHTAFEEQLKKGTARGPMVLRPKDGRSARWESILKWYIASEQVEKGEIDAPRKRTNDRNPIFFINDALSGIVRFYAQLLERPVAKVQNWLSVEAAVWDSAVLVGLRDDFPFAQVEQLAVHFRRPWSIITAIDSEGLSFSLAKIYLAKYAHWPDSAEIDFDREKMSRWTSSGCNEILWMEDEARRWIRESSWNVLSVFAHGTFGHAKLGNLVLCGAGISSERLLDNRPINGCSGLGTRKCKRAPAGTRTSIGFGDLSARNLLLHSCGGFALGGELYPSDLNSVIAIAEGFPAAFLATRCNSELSEYYLTLGHSLSMDNVGLGQIACLLNDFQESATGRRPYVLFGDACGPAPSIQLLGNKEAKWHSQSTKVKLFALPSELAGTPLAATIGLKDQTVIQGGSTGAVIITESAEPGEIKLRNCGHELEKLASMLLHYLDRTGYANIVERAVRRHYAKELSGSNSGQELLAGMAEISREISETAQAGLNLVRSCQRSLLWHPELGRLLNPLQFGFRQWDELAATLFCEMLFIGEGRGALWRSIADAGLHSHSCLAEAQCLPGHTVRETATHLLSLGNLLIQRECEVCGPIEFWVENAYRLSLEGPSELRAGAKVVVCLRVNDCNDTVWSTKSSPVVAIRLTEKVSHRIVFKQIGPCKDQLMEYSFTVPKDVKPDSHTLSAVLVHEALWVYRALRIPGIG